MLHVVVFVNSFYALADCLQHWIHHIKGIYVDDSGYYFVTIVYISLKTGTHQYKEWKHNWVLLRSNNEKRDDVYWLGM